MKPSSLLLKRSYLPIMLDITSCKILLVGGGLVAMQKINALKQFTTEITVIATNINPAVRSTGVCCIEKDYQALDLQRYGLIYACTNDHETNRRIACDGAMAHKLVNVVDDAELSDFISPAVYKKKEMVVAVSSSGTEVRKAIDLRDKISIWLDDER